MKHYRVHPLGDSALVVQFLEKVTPRLNKQIHSFCQWLREKDIPGVIEWVPAYQTVTIYYQPTIMLYAELYDHILQFHLRKDEVYKEPNGIVEIPVLYGERVGVDLSRVAKFNNITEKQVIQYHTQPNYLVYMMGFLPGFPYLGNLVKKLATARLDTPRPEVLAGSVGIAGEQTGIYPLSSPGGWNIIGHTPISLFNPIKNNPFLLKAGDMVRFISVTKEEYKEISEAVQMDAYVVKRELMVDEANGFE